jgi:hypothetical protein
MSDDDRRFFARRQRAAAHKRSVTERLAGLHRTPAATAVTASRPNFITCEIWRKPRLFRFGAISGGRIAKPSKVFCNWSIHRLANSFATTVPRNKE